VGEGADIDAADETCSVRRTPKGGEDPAGEAGDLLSAALLDLRREVRSRFDSRAAAGETAGRGTWDWVSVVEGMRRRAATLGMSERSGDVDDFGLDEQTVRRASDAQYRRHYWRVNRGRRQSPAPRAAGVGRFGILLDGLMISHRHGVDLGEPTAALPGGGLADHASFEQPTWRASAACGRARTPIGCCAGRSVVAFPKGMVRPGVRDRYRLKRFGRGRGARRVGAGVPCCRGVIGAEEAHPVLFRWRLSPAASASPSFR
jgi:hypothetical protein